MRFFSKTDIGTKRAENQDRVFAGQLSDSACAIVICDGMGGENAGSRASQMTVDFITTRFKRDFHDESNRNTIRNLMVNAVVTANTLVYEEACEDSEKYGMGTTCVAAIVHNERAHIINVGDSRAYRIFDDNIQQITKDHTYVRTLIDDGTITEEEGLIHPNRNAITRAIGAEAAVVPDYFEVELSGDDILLLCSDGLHTYGNDAQIAEIIVNNPKNKACDLLIDYAIAKDGRDNITVAIIINN